MTNCQVKLQAKFILALWVIVLRLASTLATDESNFYVPENVRSKRSVPGDEVLVIENSNPNVDRGTSQVVSTGRRLGRSTKIDFVKDPVGPQNDADISLDAEQEDDSIDDKGFQLHSVSDRNARRHNKARSGPKVWDHWGKWTSCSVSCGVGKMTRWRHCVSGACASGEKEAQIKTCALSSC